MVWGASGVGCTRGGVFVLNIGPLGSIRLCTVGGVWCVWYGVCSVGVCGLWVCGVGGV